MAGTVSVAAVTSMVRPLTTLSHVVVAMKATSLSLVGRPSNANSDSSKGPVVPAQLPTSARVDMALSSVSDGSIADPERC